MEKFQDANKYDADEFEQLSKSMKSVTAWFDEVEKLRRARDYEHFHALKLFCDKCETVFTVRGRDLNNCMHHAETREGWFIQRPSTDSGSARARCGNCVKITIQG